MNNGNCHIIYAVWDSLQIRYKCCGGRGSRGYTEWEAHLNGTYPDSCCTVRYPGCGRQAIRTAESVFERIHVRGCITTIKQALEEYVVPLLLAWGVIGVIVVVAEMMIILLCLLLAWNLRSRRKTRALGLQKTNSTGQWEEMPLRYTSTVNVNIIKQGKWKEISCNFYKYEYEIWWLVRSNSLHF